ncbi:hypothetical protein KR093_006227 [Drosophila rubida]|uniref:Uncharacterized protein n=1 Tax=Drosophila rubida TaxID=30044 RepID=A0AAD4JX56_9MUSC|nr:hypothetical protein KR093_006227 [Drosophila rubida]
MDLIKEINEKYQALEAEIDKKLEKVHAEEAKLERQHDRFAEKSALMQSPKVLSYEEALQRNANTLKSLEIAKARLRSRSTYSPVEKLLGRSLENYKKELETLMGNSSKDNLEKLQEEHEENIYELVMQNALEASSARKHGGESHRN